MKKMNITYFVHNEMSFQNIKKHFFPKKRDQKLHFVK